jgi:quercetin dioxygenase-like cupin family protein
MILKSNKFLFGTNLDIENPSEGISRQILGYDGQIMLVKILFEKGAIGYIHQHFHSQSSYVVSGKFEIMINNEKKILEAGDGFYVEPDVPHGALCIESGILIDAFSPLREDFLTK